MKKGNRNTEKQIWLDGDFKNTLENLQAKKKLATGKKVGLAELSKEIINVKGWQQVEREVLELDKQTTKDIMKLNIKFDGNFI